MRFDKFDFQEELLDALYYMGFETATPIQEQAIPAILEGKDLLACAQTGTGKTAAFMLPIINILASGPKENTEALIICPTRELAIQIEQQIQGFAYYADLASIALYGGGSGMEWEEQRKALKNGANIVVATPGKLKSFIHNDYVSKSTIKYLVLDEADRMLDIGFYDDIIEIINTLPKERQTLLFSATMPPKIKSLSKTILKDPLEISIAISKPAAGVLQASYLLYETQKSPLLVKLIADKPNYKSILIFSSTKKKVSEIVRALRRAKLNADGISSNLEQKEREAVLAGFRSRRTRILVATDVMSRGIDIKEINLVINYDVPRDAEDYVHRIGRTARAETTGVAISFVNPEDMRAFDKIEKLIEKPVAKLEIPKEMGEQPKWNPKYYKSKSGGSGHKRKFHKSNRSNKRR